MTKTAALTAILALLLALPVAGAEPGPYVSVSGAVVLPKESSDRVGQQRVTVSFKRGGGGAIAGGYALGNGMRVEAEVGYRSSKVRGITIDGDRFQPRARRSSLSLMTNALYVFHGAGFQVFGPAAPFAGVGIGWLHHRTKAAGMTERENEFAYQLMAGVKFLSPHSEADFRYRFLGDGFSGEAYMSHNLEVGITFRF